MDGRIRIRSVTINVHRIKLDIATHPSDVVGIVLTNNNKYNIVGLGEYICYVSVSGTVFLYKNIGDIDDIVTELRHIYPSISSGQYMNIHNMTIAAFGGSGGVGFFKPKRLKRSKRLNKLK